MIVDDTPGTLIVEARIVDRADFRVVKCSSSFAAVDPAPNTHICLCMMDIMMPEMDEYQAIRRMREYAKNTFPTMIATAVPECDIEKRAADGFISKPFSPRFLLNKIDKMRLNENADTSKALNLNSEVRDQ
jgi:DNA-binding response OmpR family regulator